MIIGIDLDSVIADIKDPMNRFHNEKYGTEVKIEDYTEYNLANVWKCRPDQTLGRIFEFYASPFMDEVGLMPGATEGIEYLGENHKLALITSRPHVIETKTKDWLNKFFPDKFDHVVLSNQVSNEDNHKRTKAEIGKEIGIEAMIDDHIEYAEDCFNSGITTYLFEATWNKNRQVSDGIIRISGWKEIDKFF